MKIKWLSGTPLTVSLICSAMLLSVGCAKKVAVVTPPAPVTSAAVSASVGSGAARPAPSRPAAEQRASMNTSPRTPNQATKDRIAELLKRIEDAYFDYNASNIRTDASMALQADAKTLSEILSAYPEYKLTIEGYCDERGSAEYNLALGEERARRAQSFLTNAGIPARQLLTVSYGKERQICSEHDEVCWQKNRRVHITQAQG